LTYTRRHAGAFTTFTKRVGTYKPLHFEHLLAYGPACLSEQELEEQMGVRAAAYAGFLLRRAHRFRDEEFREFHLAALRRLRARVSAGSVTRGLARRMERKLRGTAPRAPSQAQR
jgi:hypothetical protein